jgi:hypothetical protein
VYISSCSFFFFFWFLLARLLDSAKRRGRTGVWRQGAGKKKQHEKGITPELHVLQFAKPSAEQCDVSGG